MVFRKSAGMIRSSFLYLCLLTFAISLASAQDTIQGNSRDTIKSFGLFENDDLLEITLRFDVTTYLRKKPDDDFLKAELIINPERPDSIVRQVRLKTRGEFRRRECQMAPIELNFKKVDFGFSDLDSIGKLKMVTQCGFGTNDENYLLREYLVYKMFGVITDTSFRVRLVRVNYVDSERGRKPMTQWAFFIEPVDLLAERTNTIQINSTNITQKHIFPFVMDRLAMFNYMAGNYDWSIPGQHNVKIFKPENLPANQYGIAIPYDFDWSGIVNASYALPVESVGVSNVRERLFLGICRPPEVFDRHLHLLEAKKDDFYKIVNEFQYLKPKEKEDIIRYLETFFTQLRGNHNNIITNLRNSCKNF